MSFFVPATAAPTPKTKDVLKMSRVYAVLLIVMAVCQILTFSQFINQFDSFGFPGGHPFSHLLAALIVTSELLALPFLLRARMSPLARYISLVSGWVVGLLWIYVTLFLLTTINSVMNIGFLGALVNLIPGWWAVFISVAFVLLAAWASWGMWPSAKHKK
jgi:glucan phosphoethanolaminetransferase (alkaline phosphatase superfamily)